MKRIKFMFAVILSLVLMTGCIKYDATMEVKKDKSLDFKIIYAMDKQVINSLNSYGDSSTSSSSIGTLTDEQKKNLEKQGFTLKDYEDDKYKGSEISMSIKNIDDVSVEGNFNLDLSGMMNNDSDDVKLFIVKRGFLKNTYKAAYKFENSQSSSNDDEDDDVSIDTSALTSSMDMKFRFILPSAAVTNNATSVEGNTYVWDLNKEETTNLNIEFEMYNMNNIYFIIGGAILFIILIVGIIVLSTRKKA